MFCVQCTSPEIPRMILWRYDKLMEMIRKYEDNKLQIMDTPFTLQRTSKKLNVNYIFIKIVYFASNVHCHLTMYYINLLYLLNKTVYSEHSLCQHMLGYDNKLPLSSYIMLTKIQSLLQTYL